MLTTQLITDTPFEFQMIIRMLHPPRTGGSSIVKSWNLDGNSLTAGEYVQHTAPTPADFSYGFVRNPWDRVVSMYHQFGAYSGISFEDFVMQRIIDRHAKDPHRKPVDHFRPCAFWMRGATFVGRFEKRSDHLAILAKALGRPVPEDHVSKSERQPYQDYYNGEFKDLIAEEYQVDIALYGYEF